MKKTITTTLTLALFFGAFAAEKNEKAEKIIVQKIHFTDEIIKNETSKDEVATIDVDYIIIENGQAYVTYINAQDDKAKADVVRFIERSSYNFNIVPGKIYNMKLTLNK